MTPVHGCDVMRVTESGLCYMWPVIAVHSDTMFIRLLPGAGEINISWRLAHSGKDAERPRNLVTRHTSGSRDTERVRGVMPRLMDALSFFIEAPNFVRSCVDGSDHLISQTTARGSSQHGQTMAQQTWATILDSGSQWSFA